MESARRKGGQSHVIDVRARRGCRLFAKRDLLLNNSTTSQLETHPPQKPNCSISLYPRPVHRNHDLTPPSHERAAPLHRTQQHQTAPARTPPLPPPYTTQNRPLTIAKVAPACAARAIIRQPRRSGEPAADDQRAGRVCAGPGRMAWWVVSTFRILFWVGGGENADA
jgi:hypothetical protein